MKGLFLPEGRAYDPQHRFHGLGRDIKLRPEDVGDLGIESFESAVGLAAAGAALSAKSGRPVYGSDAPVGTPSPWELIGAWEIGGSINE